MLKKNRIGFFHKMSAADIAYNIIGYIIFGAFALSCILPFYYIFIVSISDNDLVRRGVPLIYPRGIHFRNYVNIFLLPELWPATKITLARTILGTFLTVFTNMFLGYAFSKRYMVGRKFFYRFIIATMYISAGLIPTFINYYNLGLVNNFWIYIFPFVSAFNIILCKTFIEALPVSLEESARIDGASLLQAFWRIVVPISKPLVATIAVFTAVGHWNDYMTSRIYVRNNDLFTLQYILYNYLNSATSLARSMASGDRVGVGIDLTKIITPTSVRMTVTMVITLPVLFVYPLFQKHFASGLLIGAVKG